ncbi:M48 family metallopeptidase [Sphingomonas sp. SRS2]|uniref:M48 family metallopeptidase n=1 Tax=Sphingomonas sp. SRS2 TaxID=133190 RepID=UPI000AFFAF33|nr:M48 family metallopeptidase [Sphingomonas sp. SRS2]
MLAPLLLAAGRSDDTDFALTALRAEDARIATVAYRIAVANRDLCPLKSPWFGAVVHELRQYAPRYRPAVTRVFDLGPGPALAAVVPGGAADRAGAQVGDRITAINGIRVDATPPGKGEKANYSGVERVLARLANASRVGPVAVTVERAGTPVTYDLVPDRGCRSQVQLETSDTLNAGADGTMISIGLEAAAAAQNDDELAISIAHEMAHNILAHRDRLDRAGVERDAKVRNPQDALEIRKTEDEADLLGLYLVAQAGYDIDVAPPYWERLSGAGDATHAGGTERRAMTQRIVDEIKASRARGEPLTPPIAIPQP